MSYELVFYETRSGHVPALEFLRGQPKPVRAEGGWLLEQLQKYGNSLGRPVMAYLEDGIHELRWQVERNEYRLLFFFSGRRIVVVTHGFSKKTKRVPKAEIERARGWRADWLARNRGTT
ncbi:MAG: type II toxin-antitoxin system RelE/ParE family toxin [Actinomycetota bacterium]